MCKRGRRWTHRAAGIPSILRWRWLYLEGTEQLMLDFSGARLMQAGAGAIVVGMVLVGVGWLVEYIGEIS